MKIVLISGKAESGKDTFHQLAEKLIKAENIRNTTPQWKVERVAFADEVKRIAADMGWDGEKDEKGRSGLVMVGDGAREYFDPLVWIKKLVKKVEKLPEGIRCPDPKIVVFVTDCRYQNEIDMVKNYFLLQGKHQVYSVRVNRPNHESKLTPEQRANRSETGLDDYKDWDFMIQNDADLAHFEREVGKTLKLILK